MASARRTADPLPLVLLTGFLGSGKTTLLNRLLRDPRLARAAVLVNEYGAVGVDHALIDHASGDVVLLENGCACCTVREGLAARLVELADQRDAGAGARFDRLVLETTGLADPAPILQLLAQDPELSRRYRLDAVLTVVDAFLGFDASASHDVAAAQVAMADCLWISKSDLVGAAQLGDLQERLLTANPGAAILWAERDPDARDLLQLLLDGVDTSDAAAQARGRARHAPGCTCCAPFRLARSSGHQLQTCVVERTTPMRLDVLGAWMERLLHAWGPAIVRMKGVVCVASDDDRPWVLQGVQGHFSAPERLPRWTSPDRTSRIVFIGKALDAGDIEASLRELERETAEPAAARQHMPAG